MNWLGTRTTWGWRDNHSPKPRSGTFDEYAVEYIIGMMVLGCSRSTVVLRIWSVKFGGPPTGKNKTSTCPISIASVGVMASSIAPRSQKRIPSFDQTYATFSLVEVE